MFVIREVGATKVLLHKKVNSDGRRLSSGSQSGKKIVAHCDERKGAGVSAQKL